MLSVAITLCWAKKPADVQSVDYVVTETNIATILKDGGDEAGRLYQNTPLDFASRQDWAWTAMWSHGLNVLRKLNLAALPVQRPIQRFENTVLCPIDGWYYVLFFIITVGYFSIFIAGWNFSFPTGTEQILWRSTSLASLASVVGVWISMQLFHASWLRALRDKIHHPSSGNVHKKERGQSDTANKHKGGHTRKRGALTTFKASLTNNSFLRDPALDAPPGLILATWFLGVFYCSSRANIIVADFMELRSLPPKAYDSVNWSAFWPHF